MIFPLTVEPEDRLIFQRWEWSDSERCWHRIFLTEKSKVIYAEDLKIEDDVKKMLEEMVGLWK